MLLKTVPLLENIEKHASLRLLQSLNARYVVVSFPLHTLGGNRKGMKTSYRGMAEELFSDLGVQPEEISYSSEMFYVYKNDI
jgi:16S rRNA (guanine(1405)-N(7))-methyltransferase